MFPFADPPRLQVCSVDFRLYNGDLGNCRQDPPHDAPARDPSAAAGRAPRPAPRPFACSAKAAPPPGNRAPPGSRASPFRGVGGGGPTILEVFGRRSRGRRSARLDDLLAARVQRRGPVGGALGATGTFTCWFRPGPRGGPAGAQGPRRRSETTPMTPENTNRPLGPIALITPAAIGGPIGRARRAKGQDQAARGAHPSSRLEVSLVWADAERVDRKAEPPYSAGDDEQRGFEARAPGIGSTGKLTQPRPPPFVPDDGRDAGRRMSDSRAQRPLQAGPRRRMIADMNVAVRQREGPKPEA